MVTWVVHVKTEGVIIVTVSPDHGLYRDFNSCIWGQPQHGSTAINHNVSMQGLSVLFTGNGEPCAVTESHANRKLEDASVTEHLLRPGHLAFCHYTEPSLYLQVIYMYIVQAD